MPTTTTITQAQRDGIYELVRNHLYGTEDLWIALGRSRDYATAARLGHQLAEDVRLLADIGWDPGEDREAFELTMAPRELAQLLGRLHDEGERVLAESPAERQSREEDEATNRRFLAGLDACEALLGELGEREGERA